MLKLLQFFAPQVVETVNSHFSGQIQVMRDLNTYYFTTGAWTQSGGVIKDLWSATLKKIRPRRDSSWLILGLAGGTLAELIASTYHPSRLVGVEIDPVMIALGNKYLKLDQIPNLEIVSQDAQKFLPSSKDIFDYILVDMYLGDTPPKFIYTTRFLKLLRSHSRHCVINHLFYTPAHRQAAHKLVTSLTGIFTRVTLHHKLTNLMIICEA